MRYLVKSHVADGRARAQPAEGFHCVYQGSRVDVELARGAMWTPLPAGRGVLIGEVFAKSSLVSLDGPLNRLAEDPDLAAAIKRFSTEAWGSYLLVLDRPGDRGFTVGRDPSGALSAYFSVASDSLLLSNDVTRLRDRHAVDWNEIGRDLAIGGLRDGTTCLEAIHELCPGRFLQGPDWKSQMPFWSPWDHVDEQQGANRDAMVQSLRDTILDTISKLTQRYARPLVLMSGGLDSSIVVAAMARTESMLEGLTMSTSDPSGDEAEYARTVAEHFGYALHERILDVAHVDLTACAAPHLPRPKRRPLYQSIKTISEEVATAIKADAYLNGNGGDQIFFFTRSATAAVDSIRAGRSWLQTLATLENICSLTNCSVMEAVQATWKRYRSPPGYAWKLQTHYLKEAITRIESQHPWLEIPAGTLPGKAVHVAMLLQMHDNIEGFMSPGGPPMITPLVAQPIVEACLHIPTWAWVHGGRDRAVARSAFRDMLPSVTIARREKQGPVSFDMQLLALRGAELREFLLGGLLAGQGIIDKRAVERSLKDILGGGGGEQQFLLELADVEAWCQHWSV